LETILLVDDEAGALAMAREILERKGYRILEAPNAEEALRIAAGYAGPIRLSKPLSSFARRPDLWGPA